MVAASLNSCGSTSRGAKAAVEGRLCDLHGRSSQMMPAAELDSRVDRLTPAQRECLWLARDGRTSKEQAIALGISRHAVDARLSSAMALLGAGSRMAAARILEESYLRRSICEPSQVSLRRVGGFSLPATQGDMHGLGGAAGGRGNTGNGGVELGLSPAGDEHSGRDGYQPSERAPSSVGTAPSSGRAGEQRDPQRVGGHLGRRDRSALSAGVDHDLSPAATWVAVLIAAALTVIAAALVAMICSLGLDAVQAVSARLFTR